MFDVKTDVQK